MRLQIDWASLIVGSKFNVFLLFYFVFESNFPSTSPRRTYIWTGLGGLIFGGAYFRNFTVYAYYHIYSINRPSRLLNFWTLRVGAYSRLGAY